MSKGGSEDYSPVESKTDFNSDLPWWDYQDTLNLTSQDTLSLTIMAESTNNKGTPNVSQEEITALFSRHSLNDFGSVQGLLHFCGEEEKHPDKPNEKCHKIASQLIAEIEAHTQINWDIEGKIEIAKQCMLGYARDHLLSCVYNCG